MAIISVWNVRFPCIQYESSDDSDRFGFNDKHLFEFVVRQLGMVVAIIWNRLLSRHFCDALLCAFDVFRVRNGPILGRHCVFIVYLIVWNDVWYDVRDIQSDGIVFVCTNNLFDDQE